MARWSSLFEGELNGARARGFRFGLRHRSIPGQDTQSHLLISGTYTTSVDSNHVGTPG